MRASLLIAGGILLPAILFSNGYADEMHLANVEKKQETVISYVITTDFQGQSFKADGKLFYANGLLLEPVYRISSHETLVYDHDKQKFIPDTAKTSISREIEAYYLLDVERGKGMEFSPDDKAKLMRTFNLKDKKLGLGIRNEPFIDDGMQEVLQHLVKEKDTIIGTHTCEIHTSNIRKAVLQGGRKDTVLTTRVVVSKQQRGLCFPFISRKLCEQLAGPVMLFEGQYATGLKAQFQFTYKDRFLSEEMAMMNKYASLYQANLQALDSLK